MGHQFFPSKLQNVDTFVLLLQKLFSPFIARPARHSQQFSVLSLFPESSFFGSIKLLETSPLLVNLLTLWIKIIMPFSSSQARQNVQKTTITYKVNAAMRWNLHHTLFCYFRTVLQRVRNREMGITANKDYIEQIWPSKKSILGKPNRSDNLYWPNYTEEYWTVVVEVKSW